MLHKLIAMRDKVAGYIDPTREVVGKTHERLEGEILNNEIRALVSSFDALIQEYEGWVCVPKEPTKEVIDAIADAHDDRGIVDRLSARELYDLILTVAPKKE